MVKSVINQVGPGDTMGETFKYVGEGIYTVPEASRLTKVPSQTIYRWLYGGSLTKYLDSDTRSNPVVNHKFDILEEVANLSFADLIQIRLINDFRKHKISLHAIRKASENAARLLDNPHPFCSARFKTDGMKLLADIQDTHGEQILVELSNLQQVFRDIISPFLKGLEYDNDFVLRWWPRAGKNKVVIDPKRSFSQPVLAREGVPTNVIYDAFKAANGSHAQVASWYEIPESAVKSAVEFEESLAA
jgi:uncharacterized protein (DUF433 family)